MIYADIIVDISHEKLDRSYRLDGLPVMGSEALAPAAELGARMGLSVQIGG